MIQLSSLRSSKDEDSNFSARAIVLTQKVVKKYYKNGKIDSSVNLYYPTINKTSILIGK